MVKDSEKSAILSTISRYLSWPVVGLIAFYRYMISPLMGQNCRFHLTCSEYAETAYRRFGLIKGSTIKRLCKCHPWHKGGIDLVPEKHPPTRPIKEDVKHEDGLATHRLFTCDICFELLLIFEWTAFSKEQQLIADQQTSTEVTTTINSSVTTTDAQQTLTTAENNVEEIPSAPQDSSIPSAEGSLTVKKPSQANDNGLIQVTTDVFSIKIDAFLGGDIVQSALLQHKVRLGNDEPYILLVRTADSTYVAQSGIVGPTATDTANGRPTFSSQRNEYTLADGEDTLYTLISSTTTMAY